MNEPRYQLTVTATQARILRDACELLFRCQIGQVGDACTKALDANGLPTVPYDVRVEAETLVKAAVGLMPNASWGVGKFDCADQACDLYQVLRHRLAWDQATALERFTENPIGVAFDPPMHYSSQPLAQIEQLPEEQETA